MDAPQEGRSGEGRPAAATRQAGARRPAPPPSRPALNESAGADLGWTVFGPAEDEEPGSESAAQAPAPTQDLPASPVAEPVEEASVEPAREPEPAAALDVESADDAEPAPEPDAEPEPEPTAELVRHGDSLAADHVADERAIAPLPPAPASLPEVEPPRTAIAPRAVEVDEPAPRELPRSHRTPTASPGAGVPRSWAALLIAVPALLFGGWVVSRLGGRSSEAKEPAAPAPSDAAQIAKFEAEIAALRSELASARGEAAQSAGLKSELERTRGEVASQIEALERALAAAQSAAAPPQAAPPPASVQASSVETPLPVEKREPRASEAASARPQPTPEDPGALATLRAQGFDRALGSLESGRGGEALGRIEGLIAQRVFSGLEIDGSALVYSLCSGASALGSNGTANAAESAGPDAPALAKARAALERATAQRPAFAQAAAGWLSAEATAFSADERLERLDFALERLGQEIGFASAELEARHAPDWERIRELGVPQDPAQALQHATSFACGHVADLCARTADAYNVSCLWSGDVDRKGLAHAAHLAAWGRLVLAHEPQERSDAELDLLWLWYAQRWFVKGETPESFDWTGLAEPEAVAPSDDWRAELRLEIELAASHFSWPGGVGARALYRVESSGPARWRVDEMRRVERDSAGWQIDRTHFDAQGKPLGSRAEVRIEQDGDVYRYASASGVLLDLRASGANVSIAHGDLPALSELPELEGFDREQFGDREAFAAAAQRACLVFQDGEWTRWFAPGLGLVREVRNGPDGAVRVELAASGATP